MGIGRRPTDDKIEVLASAKISRVVLSRILKLFDFMRAILNIFGISKIRLAKDTFLLFGDTFLPKNRLHR